MHDKALSTRASYSSAQKLYLRVLRAVCPGRPLHSFVPSEDDLTRVYVLMTRFHSVESLKGDFSAVQDLYTRLGLGDLPRGDLFTAVKRSMEALLQEADKPKPSHAFTEDELRRMRRVLDLSDPTHATFWAMCLMGFWGVLRIGSYVDGNMARGDVSGAALPPHATFFIRRNKGQPSYQLAVAARDDDLCLLGAVTNMLRLVPPRGGLSVVRHAFWRPGHSFSVQRSAQEGRGVGPARARLGSDFVPRPAAGRFHLPRRLQGPVFGDQGTRRVGLGRSDALFRPSLPHGAPATHLTSCGQGRRVVGRSEAGL